MTKAERLLALLQLLREHRRPVSGRALAEPLGVSLRTLYRDIASLQAQGVPIEGEAGLGYVLRPGYLLPPLMFTESELEALLLGTRWVASQDDPALAPAARSAMARIAAVLPAGLGAGLSEVGLLVGPGSQAPVAPEVLSRVRAAIRSERRLALRYATENGTASERQVWPLALAYFDRVRVLVAWCELRGDFRHFRLDRMTDVQSTSLRLPQRRATLLAAWRARKGVGADL